MVRNISQFPRQIAYARVELTTTLAVHREAVKMQFRSELLRALARGNDCNAAVAASGPAKAGDQHGEKRPYWWQPPVGKVPMNIIAQRYGASCSPGQYGDPDKPQLVTRSSKASASRSAYELCSGRTPALGEDFAFPSSLKSIRSGRLASGQQVNGC